MKKLGLLGLFMVLSLVILGIGYASWTDALVARTNVQTGEMRVEFINDEELPCLPQACEDYILDYGVPGSDPGELYATYDVNQLNAKRIDVTVGNLYPGVRFGTGYILENKGTIPAVFDYATVDFYGNDNLDDAMELLVLTKVQVITYNPDGTVASNTVVDDDSGLPPANLSDYETVINDLLDDVRLEPGAKACIFVHQQLPLTVVNEDYLENRALSHVLTVNFRQHNVPDTVLP